MSDVLKKKDKRITYSVRVPKRLDQELRDFIADEGGHLSDQVLIRISAGNKVIKRMREIEEDVVNEEAHRQLIARYATSKKEQADKIEESIESIRSSDDPTKYQVPIVERDEKDETDKQKDS